MAVAEAEDDKAFARKQGQEPDSEYEFVNKVDVVENFEEIDKREAAEKCIDGGSVSNSRDFKD
jgi:hypothetical protein